jgi:phosphoglycolate phosphatase-like HAD superfamily hydrolase
LCRAEIIAADLSRPGISHVIFDFDGTLSWLRNGWPDVMTQLFSEFLPAEQRDSAEVRQQLRRDILALNGKPSIHQMQRFREYAQGWKVNAPEPNALLELYLQRLDATLQQRIGRLIRREAQPEQFVIAGVFPVLDELRARGLKLVILSGTAEPEVKREATLLGLQPYFGDHIYGSTPGLNFSKKQVIDRIIQEEGIQGSHLLSFGDGPVEIEFTKAVGGLAIGVASDERAHGSGVVDEDKREHLVRAGADVIIPDYIGVRPILDTILA